MNKVLKPLILLFQLFVFIVQLPIPRKKNRMIIGAWYGKRYADNSRALYEYVLKERKDIDAYWIVKDKELLTDMLKDNIKVLYAFSLRGLYIQATSSFVFVSHSIQADLYCPAVSSSAVKIQLWHGIPLKKIGYDSGVKKDSNAKALLKRTILRFIDDSYDYVCAPSQTVADIFRSAFDSNTVLVTGSPRTDSIFRSQENLRNSKVSKQDLNILYAPTFRKGVWAEFDIFGDYEKNLAILNNELAKKGAYLSIRLHPVNKPTSTTFKIVSSLSNINFDNSSDPSQSLLDNDILITDFSSIMFDFALLNKPVLFAPFSLEEYLCQERDLYVDYRDFTSNKFISSWEDFAKNLQSIIQDASEQSESTKNTLKTIRDYGGELFDGGRAACIIKRIYDSH